MAYKIKWQEIHTVWHAQNYDIEVATKTKLSRLSVKKRPMVGVQECSCIPIATGRCAGMSLA